MLAVAHLSAGFVQPGLVPTATPRGAAVTMETEEDLKVLAKQLVAAAALKRRAHHAERDGRDPRARIGGSGRHAVSLPARTVSARCGDA